MVASLTTGPVLPLPLAGLLALILAMVLWRLRALVTTWLAVAWTPRLSRWLSRLVGAYEYDLNGFLAADGAAEPFTSRRRQALLDLAAELRARHGASITWSAELRGGLSDLRFADATRVPFPFAPVMREHFQVASVVTASRGPWLQNLDGQWTLDVSGSYGVNVAGYDRYKEWMARGLASADTLGAVLGPVHPVVGANIAALKRLSGLDEVSFHMSGTEAVMAAVRLARFNTGRRTVVTFAGAYHGWWDGVQPGLGSERRIDDCLTLRDMDDASLRAIRVRAGDLAAVLVNPIQCFHPNTPPPNDAILLTSDVRQPVEASAAYRSWLHRLRDTCAAAGVPLIFDEVYTGFRLAPGGAQQYFGVQADLVVYGKTLGGGFPIGVVCGRRHLMRRFDPQRPMRMAYVVGTFAAHPVVMGAMQAFLEWVERPLAIEEYRAMNEACATWASATNAQLEAEALPIRIALLGTVWTITFTHPGRFNWLLQYYLRNAGLTLSWVGTGRCLTAMDFTVDDYRALQAMVVEAARRMARDGWWVSVSDDPQRDTRMKHRLIRELAGSVLQLPTPLRTFYAAVMKRKEDDHHASHNHRGNQALHLVSSSVFLVCYVLLFTDLVTAMTWGLAALLVRQGGHALLEPPCHAAETLLLGFTTRAKTLVVLGYAAIAAMVWAQVSSSGPATWGGLALPLARAWFAWTLAVVASRVLLLTWTFDFRIAMIWFVKLVTDPLTDLIAYRPWRARPA